MKFEKIVKHPKIIKRIHRGVDINLFKKDDVMNLYNEIVEEYEDMEDNPENATFQDIVEIADASGYKIPADK